MLIVGLTGGIGSGKSTVASYFKDLGAAVLDADVIAREVVLVGTPAFKKIVAHFGNEILDERGDIDRSLLRDKIFAEPHEKIWLENLLHPLIRAEIKKQIALLTGPYCILVIPLLIETNYYDVIDRILVVDTSEQAQIDRASSRDQKNATEIKKIMLTQVSRKQRLEQADDIIVNDGDLTYLADQVAKLHAFYSSPSKEVE